MPSLSPIPSRNNNVYQNLTVIDRLSQRTDFSSLTNTNMSSNFFSLPRELRDQIYEQVLLYHDPIDPWGPPQPLNLGLLHVNKTIYHEASPLFYAQNRFNFHSCTPERVALFLEQIGPKNADLIRYIYVRFPEFLRLDPGEVTLKDDSVRILANIQSGCANWSTLRTSLYKTNGIGHSRDAVDNPKVVAEALKLVNTHFRAISSVQEIIVEAYEDSMSDDTPSIMESQGWTLNILQLAEEEDFERYDSDFDYGDYGYGSAGDGDDDNGDNYDIDNDSDFWRRAAD